MHPLASVGGR